MNLNHPFKTVLLFGGTFNPPHFSHLLIPYGLLQHLYQGDAENITSININDNNIDHIEFIVSMPWQKKNVLPAMHRYNMLRLALEDWQKIDLRIQINMQEVENYQNHGTLSYSILTLIERHQYYTKYYQNKLNLKADSLKAFKLIYIIGQDQYQNLHTWCRWEEIFDYAHIYVISRQGFMDEVNLNINQEQAQLIQFIDARSLYQKIMINQSWQKICQIWPELQPLNYLNHLNLQAWIMQISGISSSAIRQTCQTYQKIEGEKQNLPSMPLILQLPTKVLKYMNQFNLYL